MTLVTTEILSQMIEIATLAIEADDLERAVEIEKADLKAAYAEHKRRIGKDFVEKKTEEWEAMLAATSAEYDATQIARRKAYNAKRRLKAAIARLRVDAQPNVRSAADV